MAGSVDRAIVRLKELNKRALSRDVIDLIEIFLDLLGEAKPGTVKVVVETEPQGAEYAAGTRPIDYEAARRGLEEER